MSTGATYVLNSVAVWNLKGEKDIRLDNPKLQLGADMQEVFGSETVSFTGDSDRAILFTFVVKPGTVDDFDWSNIEESHIGDYKDDGFSSIKDWVRSHDSSDNTTLVHMNNEEIYFKTDNKTFYNKDGLERGTYEFQDDSNGKTYLLFSPYDPVHASGSIASMESGDKNGYNVRMTDYPVRTNAKFGTMLSFSAAKKVVGVIDEARP